MFKVGDRVVVVKNLLGGPDTSIGQRGEVLHIEDTVLGVEVKTKDYGPLMFMPGELEFEEIFDIMSAPHPDEETEGENGWFFSGKYKDASEEGAISLTDELQHETMEVEGEDDKVSHPSHYTSHPSGIECIEITKHYNFPIGSAMKYLWRAGLKDENTEIQDLRKAIKFIEFEIERLGGTV